MAIKIESKIIDYEVAKAEAERAKGAGADFEQMHEKIQRPEALEGRTYKIKTPLSEHALYVTINDVVLNPGTTHELRRPFEIFINSKNMDHFQWIVALTRIISAVFRKGGDCTFLAEELRSVFDPRGGYFKRGGRFMPSLVAEIGDVIEQHLKSIGLLDENTLDAHQQAFVQAKRAEFDSRQAPVSHVAADCEDSTNGANPYPESAVLCPRCHTKAMVQMEGCLTCLSCGESKCS